MDNPLIKRVEALVNYTKFLEYQLSGNDTQCVFEMKHDFTFPTMDYTRLTKDNVSVGDIIHCNSGGKTIFCIITQLNPTVINVDDLDMKMVDYRIKFFKKEQINALHKGSLGYTRKMFILTKDEFKS